MAVLVKKHKGQKRAKGDPTGPMVCVICGKTATRMVDGEPSCEEHTELVYEDQVEDATAHDLGYKVESKI